MDQFNMMDVFGKALTEGKVDDLIPLLAGDCDYGEDREKIYIWQKANEYVKKWLPSKGYDVLGSAIFEDCISYRCHRKNDSYTIFMYVYGKEKTVQLEGESCGKLAMLPFADKSTILILYLNVNRYRDGEEIKYRIRNYCGSDELEPEFWRLNEVDGTPILEYYPCKEMMDQTWQLMYAFNREDTDIYDCIITDENPCIEDNSDVSGVFLNRAFYVTLHRLHQKYGDMKLGYVRYNDVVYRSVPYIENLGFFSWSSRGTIGRIQSMILHPLDGGEYKVAELIKTEQREPDDLFDFIPKLMKAIPLKPVPTERFAVKLFFSNGECRKYVLPIAAEDNEQEVITYMDHVFTDGIWESVAVVASHESRYEGYPECGPAIIFKNGFYIAGTRCCMESEPYSEPELIDEIVYSDETHQIRKIWKWDVNFLHEDKETGLLKVSINGQEFNEDGKYVLASVDGKRLTSLTFDVIDHFKEDLACVLINSYGYGFVDKDMEIVIPMKYDEAESFKNGKAKVRYGEKWIFIDKNGHELVVGAGVNQSNYQEVGNYLEGMCRVSILKLRYEDLAFYSEYGMIAGTWGFVNEAGEEVIPPQYIYANDFEGGIAIVAKGKWVIDSKWDNEYNKGRYWTEEELWGGIDKTGTAVIPFVFDEIKSFTDRTDLFMAHSDGWENGCWGVIDRSGNWMIEPIFDELRYESWNDLILFYGEATDETGEDLLLGIYDLAQKKVLFQPQFLDVQFCDNGDMLVEVLDQELDRRIEKIIDRTGKERFKSVYSSIHIWREPYEVVIYSKDGDKHGLIDKNGNVIVPCIYEISWGEVFHEQKIRFMENGKEGIKDYDGNIIIPAIYHEIYGCAEPYLTISVGDKNHSKKGFVTSYGKPVIPAEYERIRWCGDHKHFICSSDGSYEMYVVETK